MKLKIGPKVTSRYWVAILIASMCGTNLGDYFLEYLGISAFLSLAIWAMALTGVFVADRLTKKGHEAFYWCAILIVRAAATNIADYLVKTAHLSYLISAILFACLLFIIIVTTQRSSDAFSSKVLPPANNAYWVTMLTAGALGTIIGDGVKHSFGSSQVGLPISTAIATMAVIAILMLRQRLTHPPLFMYWLAVVAVRYWGTNTGDWLADQISLTASLTVTGLALTAVLSIWKAGKVKTSGEM